VDFGRSKDTIAELTGNVTDLEESVAEAWHTGRRVGRDEVRGNFLGAREEPPTLKAWAAVEDEVLLICQPASGTQHSLGARYYLVDDKTKDLKGLVQVVYMDPQGQDVHLTPVTKENEGFWSGALGAAVTDSEPPQNLRIVKQSHDKKDQQELNDGDGD